MSSFTIGNHNQHSLRRSWRLSSTFSVLLLAQLANLGCCHLTLSKQCGELTCTENEYCRDYDHSCNPCSVICNPDSNNFSKDTCESGCQDYIHDQKYLRWGSGNGDGSAQAFQSLQRDILILKILVGVCLVVIALILSSFIAFVMYCRRFIFPNKSSSTDNQQNTKSKNTKDSSEKELDKTGKKMELATIYNNAYSHSPGAMRRHEPLNDDPNRESPSKTSATETMNSLNSAKTSAATMSTMINSNNSQSTNGLGSTNNRFGRREPSESTIPEYMAYSDSASLSPAHGHLGSSGAIYTHHV